MSDWVVLYLESETISHDIENDFKTTNYYFSF